jgi:hypothetical protein
VGLTSEEKILIWRNRAKEFQESAESETDLAKRDAFGALARNYSNLADTEERMLRQDQNKK